MSGARTAVTIGTFDGVHIGHLALVRAARGAVGEGGRVVALAFEPHPATCLGMRPAPARLTTWATRVRELRRAGCDEVHALDPRSGLLELSAEAFVGHIVDSFSPAALIEGSDFRFGSARGGDVATLTEIGRTRGFDVITVPDVELTLADGSPRRASSTLARDLLARGRVRDLRTLLGRPYAIEGEVVPGDRRGRTVGVPTANIAHENALPADGVYAARAHLPSGRTLAAAVNVGARPTVGGVHRWAEAHLLGLPTSYDAGGTGERDADPEDRWRPIEGQPEYGWRIEVELLGWIRDQVRFRDLGTLVAQLRRDCDRAARLARIGVAADRPLFAPSERGVAIESSHTHTGSDAAPAGARA